MSCDTEKIITEIKRGSTFEQQIQLQGEDEIAVNISGWSAESDLKVSPADDTLLSFDIDSGAFVSGLITLSATPAETLALPADYTLQYDVKLTDLSSGVYYTETLYLKTTKHITD